MKNVIIASGLVLIIVLSSFIALTIFSHNTRQNEVEEALTAAAEQAVSNLMLEKEYTIESRDEFVADFTQRLILSIDSASSITVNVLAVDIEKGLLDVEVLETYKQLNGSDGSASYRKTVIFDESYKDAVSYYTVTFKTERSYHSGDFVVYKTFTIENGDKLIFPGMKPGIAGHECIGWSFDEPDAGNGYSPELISEEDGQKVTKNLTLYAVFD